MTSNLEKAQDAFLDKINQVCGKFGLNNIMVQIYAIAYLESKPLSLDDMVERLRISKGSASINIRALERYGAVTRIWVKGSRKDYYIAEADIIKVITDRIKSMVEKRLSEFKDMVNIPNGMLNSINPIDAKEEEEIKLFRERLDTLKKFYNRAETIFNLLNSGMLDNLLRENSENIKPILTK